MMHWMNGFGSKKMKIHPMMWASWMKDMVGKKSKKKKKVRLDLMNTALMSGSFKTLSTALIAADLVGAMRGKDKLTVFAPTDEAFAKLPAGTLDALLKDKTKLRAVLTYHVVAGKLRANDVVAAGTLRTLNGATAKVTTTGGPRIEGASILETDIKASNGIIHVIDTVLIPA